MFLVYNFRFIVIIVLVSISTMFFGQINQSNQITCPTKQKVYCGTGLLSYVDSVSVPIGYQVTQFPAPEFVLGSDTIVTIQAVNRKENILTCTFELSVEPKIICPGDTSLYCNELMPDFSKGIREFSDCGEPLHILQFPPVGTPIHHEESIKEIALEVNGKKASCKIKVSVIDTIPPEMACLRDTVIQCENGYYIVPDYTPLIQYNPRCYSDVTLEQLPAVGDSLITDTMITVKILSKGELVNYCSFEVKLPSPLTLTITHVPDPDIVALGRPLPSYISQVVYDESCHSKVDFQQIPPAGTLIYNDTTVSVLIKNEQQGSDSCGFNVKTKLECPRDTTVRLLLNGYTVIYPEFFMGKGLRENTEALRQSPSLISHNVDDITEAQDYLNRNSVVTFTAVLTNSDSTSCQFNVDFKIRLGKGSDYLFTGPSSMAIDSGSPIPNLRDSVWVSLSTERAHTVQTPPPGETFLNDTIVEIKVLQDDSDVFHENVNLEVLKRSPLSLVCPVDTILRLLSRNYDQNGYEVYGVMYPQFKFKELNPRIKTIKQSPVALDSTLFGSYLKAKNYIKADSIVIFTATEFNGVSASCQFNVDFKVKPDSLGNDYLLTGPSSMDLVLGEGVPNFKDSVWVYRITDQTRIVQTPLPGWEVFYDTILEIKVFQGDSVVFQENVKLEVPNIPDSMKFECPRYDTVRLLLNNYICHYPEFNLNKGLKPNVKSITQSPKGIGDLFFDDITEAQDYLNNHSTVTLTALFTNGASTSCDFTVHFNVRLGKGGDYLFTGPSSMTIDSGSFVPNFKDSVWIYKVTNQTQIVQTPPPGSVLSKNTKVKINVFENGSSVFRRKVKLKVK